MAVPLGGPGTYLFELLLDDERATVLTLRRVRWSRLKGLPSSESRAPRLESGGRRDKSGAGTARPTPNG
jgi:hypothetical protein